MGRQPLYLIPNLQHNYGKTTLVFDLESTTQTAVVNYLPCKLSPLHKYLNKYGKTTLVFDFESTTQTAVYNTNCSRELSPLHKLWEDNSCI